MAAAPDASSPVDPTLVLEENTDKLRTMMSQLEDAVKQVTEKIMNDPKALGELAGKGKSVKDIPDVIPGAMTIRSLNMILETLVLLSERALDRYALPAGAAARAAVSAPEAAAPAPETKSSAGAVESAAAASGSPVAPAGPNRKQRRKQNKAAAAAADAVVSN